MTLEQMKPYCLVETYTGSNIATKITHLPTGITAQVNNNRSQYKAREECYKRLLEKVNRHVATA